MVCVLNIFHADYRRRISAPRRDYSMATDYDAPRKTDDDTESIEALKERVPDTLSGVVDVDDADNPGGFDLTGAALFDVELEVVVLPPQADEFTCVNCFLVKHRSQLDHEAKLGPVCSECSVYRSVFRRCCPCSAYRCRKRLCAAPRRASVCLGLRATGSAATCAVVDRRGKLPGMPRRGEPVRCRIPSIGDGHFHERCDPATNDQEGTDIQFCAQRALRLLPGQRFGGSDLAECDRATPRAQYPVVHLNDRPGEPHCRDQHEHAHDPDHNPDGEIYGGEYESAGRAQQEAVQGDPRTRRQPFTIREHGSIRPDFLGYPLTVTDSPEVLITADRVP